MLIACRLPPYKTEKTMDEKKLKRHNTVMQERGVRGDEFLLEGVAILQRSQ